MNTQEAHNKHTDKHTKNMSTHNKHKRTVQREKQPIIQCVRLRLIESAQINKNLSFGQNKIIEHIKNKTYLVERIYLCSL